jgi:hypothetical protein
MMRGIIQFFWASLALAVAVIGRFPVAGPR